MPRRPRSSTTPSGSPRGSGSCSWAPTSTRPSSWTRLPWRPWPPRASPASTTPAWTAPLPCFRRQSSPWSASSGPGRSTRPAASPVRGRLSQHLPRVHRAHSPRPALRPAVNVRSCAAQGSASHRRRSGRGLRLHAPAAGHAQPRLPAPDHLADLQGCHPLPGQRGHPSTRRGPRTDASRRPPRIRPGAQADAHASRSDRSGLCHRCRCSTTTGPRATKSSCAATASASQTTRPTSSPFGWPSTRPGSGGGTAPTRPLVP